MRVLLLLIGTVLVALAPVAQPEPDVSFGEAGIARFDSTSQVRFGLLARAEDGTMYSAGPGAEVPDWLSEFRVFVSRLLPSGELDAAFGNEGSVELALLSDTLQVVSVRGLASHPDGGAAVALTVRTAYPYEYVPGDIRTRYWHRSALVRLLNTGEIDRSFGRQGVVLVADDEASGWAGAIAVDGDAIYATSLPGYRERNGDRANRPCSMLLVRLSLSGDRDISFGDRGVACSTVGVSGTVTHLHVGSGIVAVADAPPGSASGNNDIVLYRFTLDGFSDETFGFSARGSTFLDIADQQDYYAASIQLPDGRIAVSGRSEFDAPVTPRVAQEAGVSLFLVMPGGGPDTSFGFQGWTWTDMARRDDAAEDPVGFEFVGTAVPRRDDGFLIPVTALNEDGILFMGFEADGEPTATYTLERPIRRFAEEGPLQIQSSVLEGSTLTLAGTRVRGGAFIARLSLDAIVSSDGAPASAQHVRIHPNPARQRVTVRVGLANSGAAQVSVVDLLGRVVLVPVGLQAGASDGAAELDVSALAPGRYVVRVATETIVTHAALTVAR